MSLNPFTPQFDALPDQLSIFPLPGAICLPGQTLPLNIFEPRYLEMVTDALGEGRMFGMVQPKPAVTGDGDGLYGVGCACRIAAFQETDDGRFIIQLTGVCRFAIDFELETGRAYRRVVADWSRFRADLEEPAECDVTFADLRQRLEAFAEAQSINVQWDGVDKLPGAYLVDLLSTSLPFAVEEKQALLEAATVDERLEVLESALVMGAAATTAEPAPQRH